MRAQKGILANNTPRWVYEVVWQGSHKNTWEPAACLLGWEREMKKADEAALLRASQPTINPVQEASAAREAAAKAKATELMDRRARLRRQLGRQQARAAGQAAASDEADDGTDDVYEEGEEDAIETELRAIEEQIAANSRPAAATEAQHENSDTGSEADAGVMAATEPVGRKRAKTSRVWLAFDKVTHRCNLPHPEDSSKVCGAGPGRGTGTSGYIQHLRTCHSKEWAHIQAHNEVKTTTQMIADAFKAKQDHSKPALGDADTKELHRLVALWLAKCGRPPTIVEDDELNTLLAQILKLCKCQLRYQLPCRETVSNHMMLLGVEGKAVARNFLVRLLRSGVKPSITGDLWSDSGMGLFGIYAHGITDTWAMEKVLIGLVACESKRHTAENIKAWTEEALKDIGLTAEKMLEK